MLSTIDYNVSGIKITQENGLYQDSTWQAVHGEKDTDTSQNIYAFSSRRVTEYLLMLPTMVLLLCWTIVNSYYLSGSRWSQNLTVISDWTL